MAEIRTTITRANIFRRGAEITRRGSAQLSQGTHTLRFCGMSATADTDTARLYSGAGVQCSNIRFETDFDEERPEERALKDKVAKLERKIEIKNLQKELWESNGDFSSRTNQSASEVQDYIEKLAERLEAISSELLEAERELEKARKELSECSESSNLPEMIAEVSVPADGIYDFEIKYFDYGASWTSLYELRSEGEGEMQLRSRANIRQNTYEDWNGIDVSLFTGSPTASGSLPTLNPQFVDILQSVRSSAKFMVREAMAGSAYMTEDGMADRDLAEPMMMMNMVEAQAVEDETTTEYILPGKKDVPKGHDGITADIQTLAIPAQYRIVTVPKLDPSAYLVAAVKPDELPLHNASQVAIYLKGVYSGNVWLDPDPSLEEIEITLGREERIGVLRKEVARKTSTTLLKGQRITEYAYETHIINKSQKSAEIVVKDQIPVSMNKEVGVEAIEISGSELDKESGILTKKIKLEPGQSELVKLAYKVSGPKDAHIVGV